MERLAFQLPDQGLAGPDDPLLVLKRLLGVRLAEDVEVRLTDHVLE